jgi:hypothetical protein
MNKSRCYWGAVVRNRGGGERLASTELRDGGEQLTGAGIGGGRERLTDCRCFRPATY